MQTALDAKACDLVMPDLERIGGVTGWLARRGARGRAQASRCRRISIPETSAHLLAVTPTAHFLEYVDWADKVVQEPLRIVDGRPSCPTGPGHGIVWDEASRSSAIGSSFDARRLEQGSSPSA